MDQFYGKIVLKLKIQPRCSTVTFLQTKILPHFCDIFLQKLMEAQLIIDHSEVDSWSITYRPLGGCQGRNSSHRAPACFPRAGSNRCSRSGGGLKPLWCKCDPAGRDRGRSGLCARLVSGRRKQQFTSQFPLWSVKCDRVSASVAAPHQPTLALILNLSNVKWSNCP